jgi:hypothetical protein
MTLCVNQSGTWRKITTLCANQSGTWRNIQTGCIKQSSTWRQFGGPGTPPTTVGSSFGGGNAICLSPTGSGIAAQGVVWIVAPSTSEVSRNWYCRNDAVTTAEVSAACGDWFVPTIGQLQNPGSCCRTYWDSYSPSYKYWPNSAGFANHYADFVHIVCGYNNFTTKTVTFCVRAFRCVTY